MVTLISTVHDPNGNLLDPLRARSSALAWYMAVFVVATETTDRRLVDALRAYGATVEIQPIGAPGTGRRRSLELARAHGHSAYLYCDFDRWLHWVGRFPDELRSLPGLVRRSAPDAWYVCIGRTERAFASHPEVQRVAERATSRAFELVIGREIDATAGSCWISPEGAEIIVAHSTEPTMGTDLEWPALIWQRDPGRLGSVRVEGLEFESAEFATEAIAAAGGEAAWLERTYQVPPMWQTRLQLAADSIAALNRVLYGPSVAVRRM